LMLADNNLSSGFEALAKADLQKLAHLDLSGNNISDVSVLEPLVALGNLQHLLLAENEVTSKDNYRHEVFELLPQLITVDGEDRDGTEIEVDEDEIPEVILSDDEDDEGVQYAEGSAGSDGDEGEYQIEDTETNNDEDDERDEEESQTAPTRRHAQDDESEDIGSENENDEEDEDIESGTDSELEDQENRPPMVGGKTAGESRRVDDDDDEEEDDDELEEDEDDEGEPQHQHQHHHHHQEIGSGSDDDDDDDEEEEDEEDDEEDGDEEDAPGLAYLLTEDIPDENDEEFEPTNEVEEESEMESSDEDEYGGSGNTVDQSSKTNGNHTKRPRSPALTSSSDFDHGQAVGFDVDGDDSTNGFGMASFDGPATFDDEATHESKRPRT
ncbi:Acidic leucine-rich nuclear phosphoprotein 32 member, partial [Mortierella sp. AM989]